MEPIAEQAESPAYAREVFLRHHARYEVSPYFVILDVRTVGVPPTHRRVQAGFDVDVYGHVNDRGSALSVADGQPQETLKELDAACRAVVEQAHENSRIEVIADDGTLVLDVKAHWEPEALVRIRITNAHGLDEAAGADEEKTLASVVHSLESLGVSKREFFGR